MGPRSTTTWIGRLTALTLIPVLSGCSSENVTSVGVTSVEVTPATVDVTVGDQFELSAAVVDDRGETLQTPLVEWSSTDDAVARVDDAGVVHARSPGEVEIRAAFRDAWGTSTVQVFPAPAIVVSRDSVPMNATATGTDPRPEIVQVMNAGSGSLGGLSVRVRYPDGESRGWLTAELGSTETPTTLTLTADAQALALGTHRAIVLLDAADVGDPPVEVVVTLTVRLI